MKIKAKDLKIGMTITSGVLTMTINNINKSFQKNGTALVVCYGSVVRYMGRGFKNKFFDTYDISIKEETLVKIK
jgi:hypothetical protein